MLKPRSGRFEKPRISSLLGSFPARARLKRCSVHVERRIQHPKAVYPKTSARKAEPARDICTYRIDLPRRPRTVLSFEPQLDPLSNLPLLLPIPSQISEYSVRAISSNETHSRNVLPIGFNLKMAARVLLERRAPLLFLPSLCRERPS